jgi:hypothetical protein
MAPLSRLTGTTGEMAEPRLIPGPLLLLFMYPVSQHSHMVVTWYPSTVLLAIMGEMAELALLLGPLLPLLTHRASQDSHVLQCCAPHVSHTSVCLSWD